MATGQTYQVQGGDNLVSIAQNIYGNPRMFAEIMRLNGLGSGVIRPGMVLKLPTMKPNDAIYIRQSTLDALSAENEYARTNNKIPTQQELAAFIGSKVDPFDPNKLAGISPNITPAEIRQATGTGGLIPNYVPPTTAGIPTPGGTASLVPSGYTSAMSPEAAKAYGTRNQGVIRELVGYSKTRPGEKMLGVSPEQPLRPGQPLPEANPFDPYRYRKYDNQLGAATNYQAAMNSLNRLNYAMYPATRNVLNAGLSLGQLAAGTFVGGAGVPLEMARRYASDWLNAPAYTTPPTSQPSQLTPPTPPTTPAGVGRVTGIPEPTYTIAEPTFNTVTPSVPKSTFTEANLPDPSIQTNLDPTNLQALGMNQSQAALYLRVITSDNPSIEDAQQFKYVFNVSDTSQLGQLLNEAIVATPSTNDQLMTNIYDDIMNLGYFGTMPSQAYAPGGGGGGGGGGGNGGASNYSGGSTWSYGGLR